MKPTTANAIKNAFQRKLHPQLPLDRRQSQQLLELISSSFRQKLDQEHTSHRPTDVRPIDRHIQSILSNPLFQSPESSNRRTNTPVARLSDQIAAVASPVAFFNQQAGLGKMTLKAANLVLLAGENKRKSSHQPSEADVREADETVDAVLNWLWASGQENSLTFLADRQFASTIARSLASSGRDDVFWRWLDKLQERLSADNAVHNIASTPADLEICKQLTERYIRRRFQIARSADEAAHDLLKLADYPIGSRELRRSLLRSATVWFASRLLRRPDGQLLDASVADSLIHHKVLMGAMSEASRALIDLFMPTPNASRAADYLSRELIWLTIDNARSEQRWSRILFSLRTIDVLLDQGRQQEAMRIVMFLRKFTPEEIQSQVRDHFSPKAAESLQARWENLISAQNMAFST